MDAALQASFDAQRALHGQAWTGVSGARLSQLQKLAAHQYATVAKNNVWMHLRKRIGAYVNMSFAVDKDALAQMTSEARKAAKVRKKRVQFDVCRMDSEARKAPADAAWVDATRTLLGLDALAWVGKPLEFHAQDDPGHFLRPMWTLLERLKAAGWRGFSLLPLRSGLTPKHMQLDTSGLRELLSLGESKHMKAQRKVARERKKARGQNVPPSGQNEPPPQTRAKQRTPEELADEHWEVWDAVCDFSGALRAELCGLHPRNRRGLAFGFSMTTDGVGCSLKFTLPKAAAPAVAPKRTHNGQHKEAAATPRLSSLPTRGLWAADQLKHLARTAGTVEPEGGGPQDVAARLATRLGVQVIGVDPGKAELAVASDPTLALGRRKIRTVRYTVFRKPQEQLMKRQTKNSTSTATVVTVLPSQGCSLGCTVCNGGECIWGTSHGRTVCVALPSRRVVAPEGSVAAQTPSGPRSRSASSRSRFRKHAALCFGERYECTRIPCHMPVALSQALCRYETRCGFLPHLAHCSTLIVHGCPASGSSSSLQLGGRVAQSASVAPTTKCAERAAVVPKCVVNKGFDGNNNG